MNTKHLIAFVGLAAAVTGITCAPVDMPPPADSQARPEQAAVTPAPLSASTAARPNVLQMRLDTAIKQAQQRDLDTSNGFWTVFHGILGLGPSVTLRGTRNGKRVNALDYIADGGTLRGLRFLPTPDGIDVETRPGMFISQGHQDQFVAEMVQWDVSPDRKFMVSGREHTFRDFVRHTKARASVKDNQELEWAILIIGQHYGTDITWTNRAGEKLHFHDLLRAELNKSLDKAACGGTHLLFGLSWCYHLHLRRGGKTVGVWKEIANRTVEYKKLARRGQNADGSFSTEYFRGRGNSREIQARINTTGHIFEWLALALSDDELHEPWMQEAANALAMMFLEVQGVPSEGGSLYHAVHGLLIYYSRVYGADKLGPLAPPVPTLPVKKAPRRAA